MKRFVLFFLIVLWVIPSLAQDTQSRFQILKQWRNTAFSSKGLEAERDSKLAEVANPVKDEFETTEMFQKRLKDAQRLAQEIRAEYDRKIAQARQMFDKRKSEIETELQTLIASSREEVGSAFTVGNYDADKQSFPITITKTGKSYDVSVPFSSAKDFKQNCANLTAKGYRYLSLETDWEYADWQIYHPAAGQNYAFGQRRGGAASPTVAKATKAIIPPDLVAQVSFSEPSLDDRLDAEETAELVVSVRNKGIGNAEGVEILLNLTGSTAIEFPTSAYIGTILPGATQTKRLKISDRDNLSTGVVKGSLSFKEINGFPPDDIAIQFETEALIPPKLAIVDVGVSDANGNAKIEQGEMASITVRVQNLGNGAADDVRAKVTLGSSDIFFTNNSQETFNLASLKPGEFKDFTFDVVSNKKATAMPISVSLSESRERFGIPSKTLDLAFNQVTRRASELVISGKLETQKQIAVASGLSVDVEKDIPIAKVPKPEALAIIFGIENYKNVQGVTFARRDAEIVNDYFTKTLGIPANRIYYQVDADVSKAEFDKVFSKDGWLEKRVAPDKSEVYFYYSGHGAPDIKQKKAYLIPYDGDPNYASQTGYSLDLLYENLGKLKVKQTTVFLDACFSGSNRESEMLLANARPIMIEITGPMASGNITVFSASGGQQISSAWPEKKHGLFTYYLLKGLQGNADSNGDKNLTVDELGNYLKTNVSQTAGMLDREQDPVLQTANPGNVILKY